MSERDVGPRYPILDIGTAVNYARQVYDHYGRSTASAGEIVQQWGQNKLHGRSRREISALRQYGLLEGSGDGDRLSQRAVKLVTLDEASAEWRMLVRKAAYEPNIFADILNHYPDHLPSDGILEGYLVGEVGFHKDGALRCIETLRANIQFVDTKAQVVEPVRTGATVPPVTVVRQEKHPAKEFPPKEDPYPVDKERTMFFATPLVDSVANLRIEGELDEDELELLNGWLKSVQAILKKRVEQRSRDGAIAPDRVVARTNKPETPVAENGEEKEDDLALQA